MHLRMVAVLGYRTERERGLLKPQWILKKDRDSLNKMLIIFLPLFLQPLDIKGIYRSVPVVTCANEHTAPTWLCREKAL